MRTRRDEIMEKIFAPIGVLLVVGGLLFVGTMATSCKSSVGVQQYQADFEKAEPLNTIPPYTGERQIVQLSKLNVNKELWDMFPELRDKRVGMGVSNRIIENFETTGRFKYAEEKEAPKYVVYAEIYDFSVSYAETYDKGKLNKSNTTIIGIQIRMVNVDNGQYIVASGQGTSTQVGEGFFKNPQMGFDGSTVGVATQRALEVATVNLVKRMEQYGW